VVSLLAWDAGAYCRRGTAYEKKGDYGGAIADFTEAIRLDPKDAWAYHGRGLAYEKKGDKAKADEDFAQAKKLGYKEK
jgi:Flp pilus assembly protein TadD